MQTCISKKVDLSTSKETFSVKKGGYLPVVPSSDLDVKSFTESWNHANLQPQILINLTAQFDLEAYIP